MNRYVRIEYLELRFDCKQCSKAFNPEEFLIHKKNSDCYQFSAICPLERNLIDDPKEKKTRLTVEELKEHLKDHCTARKYKCSRC